MNRESDVARVPVEPIPALLPRVAHAGRFAAARDVPYHTHPGTELVLVTEGACRCEVGKDNWLSADKGTMFVLPAGVPQYQQTLRFTRTTYVVFFATAEPFDPSARTIRIPPGDPLKAWMEHLCDLSMDAEHGYDRMAGALLFACLIRLSALEQRRQTRDALHPALKRVLARLEADLGTAFRADEVARSAGLSVSHMNALFRQHLGCSPLHYHQDRRLRRAQSLLLSPYARVNEVAAACGYEDANYFVRLFTRRFGISPGAWRRKQIARQRA